jgi:hypothetical protein
MSFLLLTSNAKGPARACTTSLILSTWYTHSKDVRYLILFACELGDEGIRVLANGLVGDVSIEILDINSNDITALGLADITRLLESTQLQTISLAENIDIFDDVHATQHFVSTLQHKKSCLQELPDIAGATFDFRDDEASYLDDALDFPGDDKEGSYLGIVKKQFGSQSAVEPSQELATLPTTAIAIRTTTAE